MNVFLIAAQTADGFIARDQDHAASWTSKEDKKHFVRLTKEARVMVMGSTTWKTLPFALKERLNVVYSRNKDLDRKGADASQLEITDKEPAELLKDLGERGYTDVAICGGSSIYTMFMKSGLVSKIYITVEPLLFGQGIGMFNEPIEGNLKLLSKEVTETGTVFLEYEVIKN